MESSGAQPRKPKEVYKDPIYGIPHFHDPALMYLIRKHDPSYRFAKAMKMIYQKSSDRLRYVQVNKAKCIHTRYNIDTLTSSPLMCFPHFAEMTQYIIKWEESIEGREDTATTKTQKSFLKAQNQFCHSLFLFLQEIARTAPLTPAPLPGIYSWFIQRDLYIERNMATIIESENERNAKTSKLREMPKKMEESKPVIPDLKPIVVEQPQLPFVSKTVVLTSVKPMVNNKKVHYELGKITEFDYEELHKKLVEERESDRDVDMIAAKVRKQRLDEIKDRIGWQVGP